MIMMMCLNIGAVNNVRMEECAYLDGAPVGASISRTA